MTTATVTTRLELNDPTKEVVILTVSDGETYGSKKFSKVTGVLATYYQDQTTNTIPLSCDVNGRTITINSTVSLTDQLICLTLFGRK